MGVPVYITNYIYTGVGVPVYITDYIYTGVGVPVYITLDQKTQTEEIGGTGRRE